jgi:hypothetical protein
MTSPVPTYPGSTLVRLPLSRVNDERAGVRNALAAFRKRVEAELLERGGAHGIAAGSRVHTAATAFRRHLEAERRLHEGRDSLTLPEWVALADRSVAWKEKCDRALTLLGLDKPVVKDIWSAVYDMPPPPPAPPVSQLPAVPAAAPDAESGPDPHPDAPGSSCATPGTLPATPGEADGAVPSAGG